MLLGPGFRDEFLGAVGAGHPGPDGENGVLDLDSRTRREGSPIIENGWLGQALGRGSGCPETGLVYPLKMRWSAWACSSRCTGWPGPTFPPSWGRGSFSAGPLVIIASGPSPDRDCPGVESRAMMGGAVGADGVDSRHIEREPLGNDRGEWQGGSWPRPPLQEPSSVGCERG